MTDITQPPSDRALVAATRAGSDEAWSELLSRHRPTVAAMAATATPSAPPQSLDAALDRLRADLIAGADIVTEVGTPAVRGVRPMAIAAVTGGTFGPDGSAGDAIADSTDGVLREPRELATAFARLPEAWQVVLWHRWVEVAPAAEVATLLGRTPGDVIALEQRADRGLFDAWNTVVLESDPAPPPMCRPVIALLGGYRRGTLPVAQHRAVDAHLHGAGLAGDTARRVCAVPPAPGRVAPARPAGARSARPGVDGSLGGRVSRRDRCRWSGRWCRRPAAPTVGAHESNGEGGRRRRGGGSRCLPRQC